MVKIKNLINQSLTIGGNSLAVDGELRVNAVDEEIERLERRGYIAVISGNLDADEEKAKVAADKAKAEAEKADADAAAAKAAAEKAQADAEKTALKNTNGGKDK